MGGAFITQYGHLAIVEAFVDQEPYQGGIRFDPGDRAEDLKAIILLGG